MALLNSFRISTRIYLLAAVELLLIVMVGSVALLQMQKIGTELVDIAEEDIPITNALTKITEHQLEQAILLERALAMGLAAKMGLEDTARVRELKSKFDQLALQVEKEFKQTEAKVAHAIGVAHSELAVSEFQHLLRQLKTIDQEHSVYNRSADEVLELVLAGEVQQAYSKAHEVIVLEDKIDHALVNALDRVQQFTLDAALQAEQDEVEGQQLILVMLVIAVLIAAILPFIISRAITMPVNHMKDRLTDIAQGEGDLRVRLDEAGKDETGDAARAFNMLLGKLSEMVRTISQTSSDLCRHAESTVSVMNETRHGVEQQQQETELVAAAVEEMAATVADVAKSTEQAASLGTVVTDKVAEGMNSALESQDIIQQLTHEVADASNVILSLAKETDNIGEVLDAIRSIAEQTNLLALNAAIEAARAGDSGRGFAVVADEVRALAQRTQSSTQDIQNLLQRLQDEAANAVQKMEHGQQNAAACLEKATVTASALEEVTHVADEIAALNAQIASASEQQADVANEINQNLVRITEVANQTSDGARLTTEASEEVARELTELHGYVGQLKV